MTTEATVSAAEANRQFSRILRDVREGRSYVVTSHGTPVARIVPARQDDVLTAAAQETLLARLRAQPVVVLGRRWRRDELYDG
ncbi:MAG TPA: type II toxin-antitoxin system prevent-host-death family antitoxin [Geminicoccaceae bacterium]|jgi:prevent-host-death family protein|nr:type II toxin-antitoxin system prevent-host-death family antitoxin [Geminicoccaceae bacterium]